MKRILYIVLGVVVLLVAGGAFAISRIDTAALTQKIADVTREATGKPLELTQAPSISIMPLGAKFGPASWGMDKGKAAEQGISVAIQGGSISMQLLPLLSGKVVVDEILLQSPVISVRPETKTVGTAPAEATTPPASTEPMTIPPIELGKLRITNGTVDADMGQGQIIRITALDVSIRDLMPGKETTSQISMHIDVSQTATKTTKAETLVAGMLTEKIAVRLSPSQVDFQGLELSFTPEKGLIPAAAGPVRLAGSGSFVLASEVLTLKNFTVSAAHAKLSLSGQANLKNRTFKGSHAMEVAPDKMLQSLGIAAPLPIMPTSFAYKSSLNFANNTLDIPDCVGNLDKTAITATAKVTLPQAGKQTLTVKKVVRIDAINLDTYLGTAAAKPGPKAAAKAKAADTSAPLDVANLPTLDIDITVKSLVARKIPLENIRLIIKGTAGHYTANPLSFALGTGGTVNTSSTIDLSKMRYASQGKAAQINVGSLLQAMQGKSPVNGTAQLNYDLTCGGATATAIKSSLSGKGLLLVQNILLRDVALLPKDAPTKGSVPSNFERLQVPFVAKNGVVTINPLTLTSPTLNVKGLGTVNLPQENLHMTADIAMLGITLPVVASGPFSNLSYGLDPKKMLQGVLNAPGSAVQGAGGLLQKGGTGAKDVGNTLKGLFRK